MKRKGADVPPRKAKVARAYGVLMVESETESEPEETVDRGAKGSKAAKPTSGIGRLAAPVSQAAPRQPAKKAKAREQEAEEEDHEARAQRRMQMMDFADEGDSDEGEDEDEDAFDEGDTLHRFDHEEDEDDAYHQDDEDGFGEQDDDDEEPESGAYDQEGAEEQEEEEDTRRDQKLRRLQDELADIPFGKLLEVQQTMGTKEFKRIRRGMTIARDGAHGSRRSGDDEVDDADQDEDDDDDDSDSEPESRPTSKVKSAKKAEIAKRGSKHAPAEMSSKKPVSRFRQVVELPKAEQYRDPRFNKLSGKFNDGLFKRSYGFLDDYDKSEIEDLRAAIKKEKDADTREEMERALQRKVSKRISVEKEDKRKAIQREWKKSEAKAVKEGKKPFYLKKGDQEKLALLEKYKELKGGSVDKFLEKRRKKNSSSEKRFLPGSRR